MICLKSSIKEIIQKILISSGEPFHTSDLVLELIYDYIRINANQMLLYLPTTKLPELYDLLNLCKNQPIRLIRIVKYFRTICTSSLIKTTNGFDMFNDKQLSSFINDNHDPDDDSRRDIDDDDDDDDDGCDDNDDDVDDNIRKPSSILQNLKFSNYFLPSNNSNWIRLNKLLNQLSIPLPTIPPPPPPHHHHHHNHNDDPFWQMYPFKLKQIYYQLYKGKLLRLTRIDLITCNQSIEKFLSFHHLRQSASLLNLTKSRNIKKFFYWFFYCTFNNTTTTTNNNNESKITVKTINEQYLKILHNSMTCCSTTSNSSSSTTTTSSSTSSSSLTIDSTLSSSSGLSSSSSSPYEGLHILAYLLNGDILDIIDMILFNRQKLNINLSSPITPIEIKQVLHMFTNILYPRQLTISSSSSS
ncbi:unnamed protein product [Schistosoma spindalis]|nr:unnamed protein product [Schistosoma spindale]